MLSRPDSSIAGLYLITRETADTGQLLAAVAAALTAGVRVLQYRDKSSDAARRGEQARALVALCQHHRVPMIVNDDVELALAAAADGVHLGAQDASFSLARARLGPGRIIGVSCYNSMANAERAVAAGADYVAFGAFFPSTTKPLARRASVQLLRDARALTVPVVAIGGIDALNGSALIAAGADALAVVGAVWDAADIAASVRALSSLFSHSDADR